MTTNTRNYKKATTKKPKKLVTPTEGVCTRLSKDWQTAWCIPTNLEPLKPYALLVTYSRNHRNGNFWEAKLYKDGEPIMAVENRGDGGCNYYFSLEKNKIYSPYEKGFEKVALLAYPDVEHSSSAKDMAVAFLDLVSLYQKETP